MKKLCKFCVIVNIRKQIIKKKIPLRLIWAGGGFFIKTYQLKRVSCLNGRLPGLPSAW